MNLENTINYLFNTTKDTLRDRGEEYDNQKTQERSMGKIVATFNALHGTNLTIEQGWNFMEILKMVRYFNSYDTAKLDSLIDGIAYAALRGEEFTDGFKFFTAT